LKQSQNRTKRAALMLALMSRQPASTAGWFATTPTGAPADAGEAHHDVLRVGFSWTSSKLAVVDDRARSPS
jgi:hypothetical protein